MNWLNATQVDSVNEIDKVNNTNKENSTEITTEESTTTSTTVIPTTQIVTLPIAQILSSTTSIVSKKFISIKSRILDEVIETSISTSKFVFLLY